jgi:hypothetical protein
LGRPKAPPRRKIDFYLKKKSGLLAETGAAGKYFETALHSGGSPALI